MGLFSIIFGNNKNKMDVKSYNFFISFDYLPRQISLLNNNNANIKDVLRLSDIASDRPQFAKFIKNTQVISSGVNKFPNLTAYMIQTPSNEEMAEVAAAFIIHDSISNNALYYTMEYTLGGFAICTPIVDAHVNTGVIVQNGTEFGAYCLKSAMEFFSKPMPQTTTNVDTAANNTLDSAEDNSIEALLEQELPQTDTYGTPLKERLKDVYYCINAGAEWMLKQMVEFPPVSNEGKLEAELIIAAALTDINIVLRIDALMKHNPMFSRYSRAFIKDKLELIYAYYRANVIRPYVVQTWSLMDFYKLKGKLKLCNMPEGKKNVYGNTKFPAFVDANGKITICSFAGFEESEMTADYIIRNKDLIIVEERDTEKEDEKYVFFKKSKIDIYYDCFFDKLIYYIYCHPMRPNDDPTEEQVGTILREQNLVLNKTNPAMSYAFHLGFEMTQTLAVSTCLLPV